MATISALCPISIFAISASSTSTSVYMLAGFAIVISEEPGIVVELAIAVSPTFISRLVTTPSIGEMILVFERSSGPKPALTAAFPGGAGARRAVSRGRAPRPVGAEEAEHCEGRVPRSGHGPSPATNANWTF